MLSLVQPSPVQSLWELPILYNCDIDNTSRAISTTNLGVILSAVFRYHDEGTGTGPGTGASHLDFTYLPTANDRKGRLVVMCDVFNKAFKRSGGNLCVGYAHKWL